MIRSAVTINTASSGGPFIFHGDLERWCKAAAELGFDAVEVFPPSAAAVHDSGLGRLLRDHNLKLAAVGTGAGWVNHKLSLTSPDKKVRERAREFVAAIVDAAGMLGAPAIIGSMQGRCEMERATTRHYLREALAGFGEWAAPYNVPLLFEPLNRYETDVANTLDDGRRLVTEAGAANVKLLADLFHMNIEEADMAESIRAAGKLVGHVHFADSNRLPAGGGHTDFAPIVQALREIGYDGYASVEAFPLPGVDAAARAAIAAHQKYFG